MADPFERNTSETSGVGRLLGRAGKTALREIEDLLARAQRVREVEADHVKEVADRHGVDLGRRLRTPRRNLYRRFFEYCLVDHALSDDEIADLAHLRAILELPEDDIAEVHEEVAFGVYGRAIDEVLADQRLDPEEEDFLKRLRGELGLTDDAARALYDEGAERARRKYLDRAAVHDSFIVTSRDTMLDFSGSSETSIEDAIRSTLDEAGRAVPRLAWVEVSQIGADVDGGEVQRWHVKLRGKLGPEE